MDVSRIIERVASSDMAEQAAFVRESARDLRGPVSVVGKIQDKLHNLATAMEDDDAREAYKLIGKMSSAEKKYLPWNTYDIVRKALSWKMDQEGDESPFLPKVRSATLQPSEGPIVKPDFIEEEKSGVRVLTDSDKTAFESGPKNSIEQEVEDWVQEMLQKKAFRESELIAEGEKVGFNKHQVKRALGVLTKDGGVARTKQGLTWNYVQNKRLACELLKIAKVLSRL
jgi:hypothetical protein